jgi:signal transduction histidine kinase
MNRRTKYSLPGLMVFSQLLLLVFVLYWLKGQYNEEKGKLQKELALTFFSTQDQLVDSVLLKNIVKPFGNDSAEVFIKIAHDTDSTGVQCISSLEESMRFTINDTLDSIEVIGVNVLDSFKSKEIKEVGKSRKDQMLVKSVKLFVDAAQKRLLASSDSFNAFPFPMDTSVFKTVFSQKLSDGDFDLDVVWLSNENDDTNIHKQFVFRSDIDKGLPGVKIEKYLGHILRRIFPEIAFAFLLLLLTGSAFYFTYKSLVKQYRLGQMREAFFSNITHELKTPVSTMKVALEAIQGFTAPNEFKGAVGYIEMARSEADRLDQLINHILSHSKLESDKQILNSAKVDVAQLVHAVLNAVKVVAEQKGAKITFVPPGIKPYIFGDALLMQSVLHNIIDNSLKYSGNLPEIAIQITGHGKNVQIQVRDKGPGIPEKYMDEIFKKFFRVPQGNTHNVKGYGLGLSYARLIMHLHKGEITVRNLKVGCEFTLAFPKAFADEN